MGDSSPRRRRPISWGDRQSRPQGGCRLNNAYGGKKPPSARVHDLGRRRVLPRRWSRPKERLWGMAAPIGADPPAGGTGSPTQEVVAA